MLKKILVFLFPTNIVLLGQGAMPMLLGEKPKKSGDFSRYPNYYWQGLQASLVWFARPQHLLHFSIFLPYKSLIHKICHHGSSSNQCMTETRDGIGRGLGGLLSHSWNVSGLVKSFFLALPLSSWHKPIYSILFELEICKWPRFWVKHIYKKVLKKHIKYPRLGS